MMMFMMLVNYQQCRKPAHNSCTQQMSSGNYHKHISRILSALRGYSLTHNLDTKCLQETVTNMYYTYSVPSGN